MSLTKLSLGRNNDVIYKLFPPRESLVSDIPAGNGKIGKLFLCCWDKMDNFICNLDAKYDVLFPVFLLKEEKT
jgi:hypothetical protein